MSKRNPGRRLELLTRNGGDKVDAIHTQAETLRGELKGITAQLQQVENQRQQLIQLVWKYQGAIEILDKLDSGRNENRSDTQEVLGATPAMAENKD